MVFISSFTKCCVNKYCNVNDIDNMSDHLPLCMYINLPVNKLLSILVTLDIVCLNLSGLCK